ncbi:MAG TPA: DUF2059 domain-containing protein [Acidobacteriaceae bacterium]|jgi:hypothetical protein|nr:DUF2059 domain-containing protein [Acidobacteriaceae bacterium]
MRRLGWVLWAGLMVSLPLAAQSEWNPDKAAEEAQRPEHPVTAAQVHELMVLTGATTLRRQVMSGMAPYLKQAVPFLPEDVLEDFEGRMEKADFESMAVTAYQKRLSSDDAAQLIAFYQTPVGKRVIAAMPQIVAETQQAGAQLGQQVMAETLQAHRAEIQAAVEKYKREHAAAPPK